MPAKALNDTFTVIVNSHLFCQEKGVFQFILKKMAADVLSQNVIEYGYFLLHWFHLSWYQGVDLPCVHKPNNIIKFVPNRPSDFVIRDANVLEALVAQGTESQPRDFCNLFFGEILRILFHLYFLVKISEWCGKRRYY